MKHKDVAQSQLLNCLTNKYLQKHHPESVLFLGVSGGNGLEHIDDKEDLQNKALKFGFELIGSEENILPNGKSFLTCEFGRGIY